ncbi:Exodeoxyribonuclease V beta chain [Candidatus Burkholderia humilis]|nr:Exodeoxyribonuclease V beta chain [Candidatus Burkholderia humilis]
MPRAVCIAGGRRSNWSRRWIG